MKNVVLLGDSIRQIGYGTLVPQLLGEEYSEWQPKENCRFAAYTLRLLFDNRTAIDNADIIHWNNGLWDVCDLFGDGPFTDAETYVKNMLRIATLLKRSTDKIIFATTTPVTSEHAHSKNERIRQYNALLVPQLQKMGIVINDLYSLVAPNIDTFIRKDDNIHLTEEGIRACSEQVVRYIKSI